MLDERISAAIDGECSVSELRNLLNEAATSPEAHARLMRRWSQTHRVRDALAGCAIGSKTNTGVDDQFCAGVMSCLGLPEPEVAAPASAKVIALPIRREAPRPLRQWRSRPVVGWAAAASLALVALAGGRAWLGTTPEGPAVVAAVGGNSQLRPVSLTDVGARSPGLLPVSSRISSQAADEPSELRWTQLDPDTANELNGYLIEHNSSRAEQGMNGALGDARLATHNVNYRSDNESR